ncbi:MAG: hypothetical protein J7J51_03455, partial [Candidatus Omnitrophica bacterium]|nr:hypothetical protein [Candidatus Omnitrophota bacterium]
MREKKDNNLEESEPDLGYADNLIPVKEEVEMPSDKASLFFLRAEAKKRIRRIIRKSICLTIIFTFLVENISFSNPDIFSGRWRIGRWLHPQPPSSSAQEISKGIYVSDTDKISGVDFSPIEFPKPDSEADYRQGLVD